MHSISLYCTYPSGQHIHENFKKWWKESEGLMFVKNIWTRIGLDSLKVSDVTWWVLANTCEEHVLHLRKHTISLSNPPSIVISVSMKSERDWQGLRLWIGTPTLYQLSHQAIKSQPFFLMTTNAEEETSTRIGWDLDSFSW